MRLADRQGLFTGQINVVQTFGVDVLMMLDRQVASEDWWRNFRAQIGAANPTEMKALLPEYFEDVDNAATIDKQATTADGERDYDLIDESQIVWGTPASEQEREEVEAFLAEALSKTHTITASDLQNGGQWL